jgi:ankyrin repeat protein
MHKSRLSHLTFALFAILVWWGLPVAHAGELSDAVKAGDVKRVEVLIAGGAKVKAHDFFGTPLHVAAAGGFPEIAKMLIDAGADLEAEGIGKGRPLHTAALTNHAAVATLLIERGAKVDPLNAENMTPLLVAAENGNADVAEVLLKAGANPLAEGGNLRYAPIQLAAYSCRLAVVKLFVSKGLDPNLKNSTNGETPLFAVAAEMGAHKQPATVDCRIEMTELLLAGGANPNVRDKNGNTPYQRATEPAIRDLLVKFGAK